ncbi:PREDICTED: insulin-like receptor [Nicrophorus vespilloides]|uniref:Tyrosine-protein kinase receptor n=1 Tax=Nicrophorus vespilloides TaxID=110193 RepID=A0ABM1MDG5_NICVS|nr:PREDICTED: insulin-like receptor [Nicrophorus vespilloides]XP_017772616.1 PREDICTED: insulin-like receptor [Nicrophorus vespilloides]
MAATGLTTGGALLFAGALLAFISSTPTTSEKMPITAGLSPKAHAYIHSNTSGICKSIDVRNSMQALLNLRGCRVVEGFVQISLFDAVEDTEFEGISFPELTEITDFLLLYRVHGLRSVGQLFPNLAVIRGQDTVLGYSFIIYELSGLQEVGLYSLTDIQAGLIRIDKNPELCFVNSIDWDKIAHEKGEHYIKNIKAENECPLCPGEDEESSSLCPASKNKNGIMRFLCWNRVHCQKVCPSSCKTTCDAKGKCCDEKCLGGCREDNPRVCHVCRNFTMGEDGTCTSYCPADRYEYLGRRCVTKEECINTPRPLRQYNTIPQEYPYKTLNKSCLLECPSDYTENYDQHKCFPCLGRCKKECQGMVIDSVVTAKRLRGCTHINGSLEIQIRSGGRSVVSELEENLSMIEEIDGYIKVVRSFPLVSLNFFKNLKVIRGNSLEFKKYVVIVSDNQNLQDLWDFENRTLKIDHGGLFFHFNPKLCMYKIEALREMANLSEFEERDVASNSNGDRIACNVQNLVVNVTNSGPRAIVLAWAPFEMKDHRALLGYVVYSIKAPEQNITLYDGRDACGGDGWRVDDIYIDNQKPTHILTHLEPYTQYAFYVRTYTIATEKSGAQSKIQYVRTMADRPSVPYNIIVKTDKSSSSSFDLTWKPPLQPNGNVTYYIITGIRRDQKREDILRNRNYCNPSMHRETVSKPETKISTAVKQQNNTCECRPAPPNKPQSIRKQNAEDVSNQMMFEDNLINFVYVKRIQKFINKDRSKRDLDYNLQFPNNSLADDESKNRSFSTQNKTDMQGKFIVFSYKVYGKTELRIDNLKHFTAYEITIEACQNKDDPTDMSYCSQKALTTARTESKAGADKITEVRVANKSMSMVTIVWDEPLDPNGHILTYQIEYKRLDIENSQPILECITALDYLKHNKRYTLKLNPGNYSLRVIGKSQADYGEYSKLYSELDDSKYSTFSIDEPNSGISELAKIAIGLAVVFTFIVVLACVVYKNVYHKNDNTLIKTVNPEYVSTVYEPDDWEVLREKISLIKELGQGSFGMVYEGIALDIKGKAQTRCAIKTVNEHATDRERIEFLNEASVMKAFDTAYVVRLLGVVSQGQPTLVVMELMANGDLKSYLRSHRPDVDVKVKSKQPPTLKRIMQMAIEIADGMAYLAAKKFVHRDLAARNCMVAEDLTVKIGDFGMTRDIYETDYYRKGTKGLLPVRWMAPESLKDGVFTSNSDVWSYGVVLWEMATLASQPYQGLSNDQVLRYVIDGGIMERPENCPDKLYNLMRFCWKHKPSDRPTFINLCKMLLDDSSQTFSQISFYHSAAGMEARNFRSTLTPCQDDARTPLRSNQDDENMSSIASSDSSEEEELEPDTNIEFITYTSTANGFVGANK